MLRGRGLRMAVQLLDDCLFMSDADYVIRRSCILTVVGCFPWILSEQGADRLFAFYELLN